MGSCGIVKFSVREEHDDIFLWSVFFGSSVPGTCRPGGRGFEQTAGTRQEPLQSRVPGRMAWLKRSFQHPLLLSFLSPIGTSHSPSGPVSGDSEEW